MQCFWQTVVAYFAVIIDYAELDQHEFHPMITAMFTTAKELKKSRTGAERLPLLNQVQELCPAQLKDSSTQCMWELMDTILFMR